MRPTQLPHVTIRCRPPAGDVLAELAAPDRKRLLAVLAGGRVSWVPHRAADDPAQLAAAVAVAEAGRDTTGPAGRATTLTAALAIAMNHALRQLAQVIKAAADRPLTAAEAHEIIQYRRAADQLRNAVIEANVGLIVYMVGRWVRRHPEAVADVDELRSAAQIGLVRATESFCADRGYRFTTYACRCIHQALLRIREDHARRQRRHVVSIVGDHARHEHYHPRDHVLADAEHTPRRFREAQAQADREIEVRRALAAAPELTRRERYVLRRRYGIGRRRQRPAERGNHGLVRLETIGAELGVSKERVRQLEKAGLAKLRAALAESGAP